VTAPIANTLGAQDAVRMDLPSDNVRDRLASIVCVSPKAAGITCGSQPESRLFPHTTFACAAGTNETC
jgi:hypothetical protein